MTTQRKALVDLELSSFMPPPAGEALVLGKNCPFSPESAKKMLDLVAPGDFEFVKVESSNSIDCVLVRAFLFKRMNKAALVRAIVEEAEQMMGSSCALSVKCSVRIAVQRRVESA